MFTSYHWLFKLSIFFTGCDFLKYAAEVISGTNYTSNLQVLTKTICKFKKQLSGGVLKIFLKFTAKKLVFLVGCDVSILNNGKR